MSMLTLSATQLARGIRDGRWTSTELVEGHIAHIQRVNPTLNAMVWDRFELARDEASKADAELTDAPFHGVPCSIKECFALTGMPNSSGLWSRRDLRAQTDATAVARYRAAGAIPLGVTNTSELCMWMESDNRVYGRSNNPYDPRRTVGGSSGGEGAIVGAGGAPFGLGSDIGGSIRMPAFFNGVFGHKPSGGLVPGTGQFPMAEGPARRMLATGPLCRRAEDLYPLLQILAGPDGHDGEELVLEDPRAVELSSLVVFDIPDNGVTRPTRAMRGAQQKAASTLEGLGARVERLEIPRLKKSFEIWSAALSEGAHTPFPVLMGDGERVPPGPELMRRFMGRSHHTFMCSLLGLAEELTEPLSGLQESLLHERDALRQELDERLGDDGVLLFPPFPRSAPRHRWPLARQLMLRFDYSYTAILNAMHLPATAVPMGLDNKGVPLGLQVAAGHGNDHLCLAVATALEEAWGGWVPPRRWIQSAGASAGSKADGSPRS